MDIVELLHYLGETADRLDLYDPEDRAHFRTRLERRTRRTKVSALFDWCELLRIVPSGVSRHEVTRSVADAYIERMI